MLFRSEPAHQGKGDDSQHGSDTGAGDCITNDTDRSVDGIHRASSAESGRVDTAHHLGNEERVVGGADPTD